VILVSLVSLASCDTRLTSDAEDDSQGKSYHKTCDTRLTSDAEDETSLVIRDSQDRDECRHTRRDRVETSLLFSFTLRVVAHDRVMARRVVSHDSVV